MLSGRNKNAEDDDKFVNASASRKMIPVAYEMEKNGGGYYVEGGLCALAVHVR